MKYLDKITDVIVLIVLFTVLLIGVYAIYDTLYVYSGASPKGTLIYKPGESSSELLTELSDDCIGWITLDDTNIDYPIMQGNDNSKYLNTDPYGSFSLAGSIFLDCRNASDFSDDYSLIYGHHMDGAVMFGSLDYYLESTYFDKHRTGLLTAADGKEYKITVFASGVCSVMDTEIFDLDMEHSHEEIISFAKENATCYKDPMSQHIIALTTCKKPSGTDRTYILCYLAE